jgi:protein tyrosine phosphatase (PTP) superfamily phosphohydrolase (DUF442 family)
MNPPRVTVAALMAMLVGFGCLIAGGMMLSRNSADHASAIAEVPPLREPKSLAADGIENLWKLPLADGGVLYSGGQPDGDAAFASLEKLGVKTVISVDGARPAIEVARQHGLKYVHLPIGYNDVPADRLATMIAAVKSLPGSVFIHCHHGKHRGPAATVCVWRALRGDVTPQTAVNLMNEMGTAEKYRGLYRAANREPPADEEIPLGMREFPEVTAVAPLAEQMVEIEHVWEEIRGLVKASEWTGEQRMRLQELFTDGAERFRESARMIEGDLADELSAAARRWEDAAALPSDQAALEKAIEFQCQQCHAKHRDGN